MSRYACAKLKVDNPVGLGVVKIMLNIQLGLLTYLATKHV